MRATDDAGDELNAEFEVEPDGDHLALVMRSAGGKVAGSPHGRNHQYNEALELLLRRLRELGAVIVSGVVDSATARKLPEEQRSIVDSPIVLAETPDVEALRRRLGRAQGRIGQNPDGNATKLIRLRLQIAGYAADDAVRLAAELAKPSNRGTAPDALALLRSLIGDPITTATGKVNTIVEVTPKRVRVTTEKSPEGQWVGVRDVEGGLAKLYGQGSVLVNVEVLGHRSSFVGAVLLTIPGTTCTLDPVVITLHDTKFPVRIQKFEKLDGIAQVKIRKEQSALRRLLLGGRTTAPCDLCGHDYPGDFLVAAHIKKRSLCTDDERNDLANVAMLACKFGCDSLFESGHVAVNDTGRVLVWFEEGFRGRLHDHLTQLDGRACGAHRTGSHPYFTWHRTNVYRGLP
ncbi:HNH endonuclease [Lentzea sp. NPDC058450]|uniref:HNH endonuclease n=1 Tax=Lentzea sp. NPDC058450 TaxID=3346505 RepID=UPI003663AB06